MEMTLLTSFWEALAAATSRRGVLTGLGWLLAASPFAQSNDEALAKKRGKRRKKKRRNKRNKAQTRVDATCPTTDVTKVAPSSGDVRLAQTFTAKRSGQLVRAELVLLGDGNAAPDFIVRLAPVDEEGVPTNDVLAEASISGAAVSVDGSTVSFDFSDPARVAAGTEYALVLARPESEFFSWALRGANACDGRAFSSLSQGDPFQPGNDQSDFIFTAFVRS